MKAVVLAAGKSTRTYPLTVNMPKALLPVASPPVLEHNLRQLQGVVEGAVIVCGFGSAMIQQMFGGSYGRLKLSYAEQKQQLGTGNALMAADGMVSGKFLVLMGDDIYGGDDIKRCAKRGFSILAGRVNDISSFGEVLSVNGFLSGIREKPERGGAGLVNTGVYVVDERIFGILAKLRKSSRGEYELTDAVSAFAKVERVAVEESEFWQPITYPWSLLDANEAILKRYEKEKTQISSGAVVEKGAIMKGFVSVGKGTLVRSGAYIEGPVMIGENCKIGPNCYIRPYTAIGSNCKIGNAVEVKNSILMDNAVIGHLSYCGDSVIGEGVNFGAGTIVANLRHDNGNVKSMVKGALIATGRRKLGAIIGDKAKTGIHTSIYPGRKIWPGKTTMPGEVVKKDVI